MMYEQIIGIVLAIILVIGVVFGVTSYLRSKVKVIKELLDKMTQGDLTKKLHFKKKGIFKELCISIDSLILKIRGFINQTAIMADKLIDYCQNLRESAQTIQLAADNTCKKITDIFQDIERQASYMIQTEELIQEIVQGQGDIAQNGVLIENMSSTVVDKVKEANEIYEQLTLKLNQSAKISKEAALKNRELVEKAYKIQSIVDVVNQISSSTKFVALNASIEAARAGEYGSGFSVVAQEIQKLADMSAEQAKEIQNIITDIKEGIADITSHIEKEVEVINENIQFSSTTRDYLDEIAVGNQDIFRAVKNINQVIEQQSQKITVIKSRVGEVTEIAEKITQSAKNVSISAEEQLASMTSVFESVSDLTDMNKDLKKEIDAFAINYVIDDRTQKYIDEGLKILIDLSRNKTLAGMEHESCTRVLKEKIGDYPYFELFGLVDQKGLRKAVTLDYTKEEVLVKFSHRRYFKEAMKGNYYQSEPYISGDTNNYCIALAVPVKDEGGTIRGVLVGDLILD